MYSHAQAALANTQMGRRRPRPGPRGLRTTRAQDRAGGGVGQGGVGVGGAYAQEALAKVKTLGREQPIAN